MKIKFLKDHLDNKAGSEADLPEAQANYLILVKVATAVIEKKIVLSEKVEFKTPVPEKVEFKPGDIKEKMEKETKAKSGKSKGKKK